MSKREGLLADLNQHLFQVVRNYDRFRVVFAREQNVSVTELRALSRIVEERTMTPKALAASLELTTGAVTALVDRMVESDLVVRQPHPSDRRSLLLAPTEAGDAMMKRVRASYENVLRAGAGDMDDERLTEFCGMLDELIENGRNPQPN